MSKFLTIREGPSSKDSYPIIASSDPELIAAVGKLIAERLAFKAAQPARRRRAPITLVPKSDSNTHGANSGR
jgi:hypothetical protein